MSEAAFAIAPRQRTVRAFSPPLGRSRKRNSRRYFALKIIECPPTAASRTSPPTAARLHVPTNADLTRYSAISVLEHLARARAGRRPDGAADGRTLPSRRLSLLPSDRVHVTKHETTGHKLDNLEFSYEPRRDFEALRHVARSFHVFTWPQKAKRDTKMSLHPGKTRNIGTQTPRILS